jgi:hypothetical protein
MGAVMDHGGGDSIILIGETGDGRTDRLAGYPGRVLPLVNAPPRSEVMKQRRKFHIAEGILNCHRFLFEFISFL